MLKCLISITPVRRVTLTELTLAFFGELIRSFYFVANMGHENYRLNKAKPIIAIIVFALLAFSFCSNAFAALDIQVRPYEGGYDLRYHNVDLQAGRVNQELIVDITSDIGKQYRLIQVLQEPLTTDQGVSIPQGSFVVYAIRGSNKYGTVSVETDTPVFYGRTVIYTSNASGLSDSFILVYGLILPPNQEPGSYRGRLQFTLEPIDSSAESKTFILNIFADIEARSRIDINTSSQDRVIHLDATIEEKKSSDVVVNITGGLGKQFRIIQLISDPLISTEGNELKLEKIKFTAREAKQGIVANQPLPLSLSSQAIYTSGSRGQPDSFAITYSLDDLKGEKAGSYLGNIKYLFEGESQLQGGLIETLRLEVENPRLFDLAITPELGGRIEFRDLKPMQPAKTYEVLVKVNSNLGKRYQVNQMVATSLMNKEGHKILPKYFTCRTAQEEATKGSVRLEQKSEVEEQRDMSLFISDKEGSSDSFKVIYELTPPPDVQAGDYSTTLVYSLLEI